MPQLIRPRTRSTAKLRPRLRAVVGRSSDAVARMGDRDQRAHAAVRERVLRAAEGVFAQRGFAGATTQEIARAAGIQKRMLFYYFPGKEVLYARTLDRFLGGIRDIHARFRNDPGPIGLQEIIEGMTRLVVMNPDPVRILIREIMDDGPHLARIVDEYIAPLFVAGAAETRRNMEQGVFQVDHPEQVMVHIGGLTIFYFIIAPMLRQLWGIDPLGPEAVEARIAATTRFALGGMMARRDGSARPAPTRTAGHGPGGGAED